MAKILEAALHNLQVVAVNATTEALVAEVVELRALCAEFYVIFGALDAPGTVLDQAFFAASGRDLPHALGSLLPFPEAALKLTPATGEEA